MTKEEMDKFYMEYEWCEEMQSFIPSVNYSIDDVRTAESENKKEDENE